MIKHTLLATCGAAAFLLGAAPALAQETQPAETTGATPTIAGAQDDAADATQAEDIVVTAQGRAQALADVPVAVSAVSAEALRNSGATDIRQLNQLAPSLLVSSTGSEANGSARIRGVGTVGDNPGLESSVAVFIDGVYRSRSGIGLNELGEIERIEVLRGPQGTLGGRNSSAGLISIITQAPSFTETSGNAEASYGNYDYWRFAGAVNAPLSGTVAARLDGVYVKRDGFYYDPTNDADVNDRDRYLLRGQLRFQPNSDVDVRLIADYSRRDEKCCAAIYVDNSVNPYIGDLNNPVASVNAGIAAGANGNNIVNVLGDLGQPLDRVTNPGYDRTISVSPGRGFGGVTRDYGFSGQIDWNLGGAHLTSITAYRYYKSDQGADMDYSAVDILYRAPDGGFSRRFKTFSQELRLNGTAFDDRLDWLVGGYFADEHLRSTDNLRFGDQYGRFATCRIISGGGLAGLYSPTSPSCVVPGIGPATIAGATGASGPDIVAGFTLLDSLNDLGSNDVFEQNSRNFALFTHNIFHVTDTVDVTIGLRYTNERKTLDAAFGNDNTICPALQASLLDDLSQPQNPATTTDDTARSLAGALIALGCQGNSSAELSGVDVNDEINEDKLTGTAILSWKPIDDLLVYGSYSRGYKAGGFNLDRSALKSPILPFSAVGGAQALVGALRFDPETVDAFEIGAKYARGPVAVSIAAFLQDFDNFQLNTFNGSVFLVQNINGCSTDLNGGDRDQSKFPSALNYNPAAATTGACPSDDVGHGVRAQGIEIEASITPMADLSLSAGLTLTDTSYRDQLVGNSAGAPLDQALRELPGERLSNSAGLVVTSSVAWTPPIGSRGLSALFYIDGRATSDYNTGSDLFPQKEQEGYAIFNARVGIRGPEERWSVELWGQNIFNKDYAQVAFNSPFQEGGVSSAFQDPRYPGGRQLFSQYLAEPRTYGVTLRGRF